MKNRRYESFQISRCDPKSNRSCMKNQMMMWWDKNQLIDQMIKSSDFLFFLEKTNSFYHVMIVSSYHLNFYHCIASPTYLSTDCFDSLDKVYRKQLDKKNKIEIMQINKLNFLAFLKETREEVMIESIIRFVWVKTDTILWKIHRFTRNLLTNSDIYSFDSTRMLKQLSQHDNRFMISSSSLISTILNKISINQSKLKNLLQSLNFYTLNHRIKLSRVKKTIDLLSADLILARNATKMLFKANITKKTRKKIKANIIETFRTSFERVLIENEVIRLREEEIKKSEDVMLKKMTAKIKKSVAAEKKRVHAKEMTMRKKFFIFI